MNILKTSPKKLLSVIIGLTICIGGILLFQWLHSPLRTPIGSSEVKQYHRILDQYTFLNLRERTYTPSPIKLERVLQTTPSFTAYLFTMSVNGRTVSGQLNLPKKEGKLPVIVMVRGYVDKEIYRTGIGTNNAARFFADHGYITIAPDFLGYGQSDQESFDVFEARFEKPVTILTTLASIPNIPHADTSKVGIWAHSNGGQIAISVLEISQKNIPTTLWAPVTEKFPNGILRFVDELPDKGEYLKKQLALFHERYRDEDYSIPAHYADILAPVQLHQGLADEYVPFEWSEDFVKTLKEQKTSITFFTYPNENHNFTKGSSPTLLQRDLQFFHSHFL